MSENEKYLKEERLYKVLHEKHYDGIGPTDDEEGLPLALRSVSMNCLQSLYFKGQYDGVQIKAIDERFELWHFDILAFYILTYDILCDLDSG